MQVRVRIINIGEQKNFGIIESSEKSVIRCLGYIINIIIIRSAHALSTSLTPIISSRLSLAKQDR